MLLEDNKKLTTENERVIILWNIYISMYKYNSDFVTDVAVVCSLIRTDLWMFRHYLKKQMYVSPYKCQIWLNSNFSISIMLFVGLIHTTQRASPSDLFMNAAQRGKHLQRLPVFLMAYSSTPFLWMTFTLTFPLFWIVLFELTMCSSMLRSWSPVPQKNNPYQFFGLC